MNPTYESTFDLNEILDQLDDEITSGYLRHWQPSDDVTPEQLYEGVEA